MTASQKSSKPSKERWVVRINVADPQSASHADYFERYKVKIARLDGTASSISDARCVVVKLPSNTGTATIDPTVACDSIGDVG